MKQFLCIFLMLIVFSCKKDAGQNNLIGNWKWVIQYSHIAGYTLTPQNTGIQETLTFNSNNSYALTQNGIIVNSGIYKLSTVKGQFNQNISTIFYTNQRVTDSVDYYTLENNNDSLFFSYDLIGTIGSGSRHYGRQ